MISKIPFIVFEMSLMVLFNIKDLCKFEGIIEPNNNFHLKFLTLACNVIVHTFVNVEYFINIYKHTTFCFGI